MAAATSYARFANLGKFVPTVVYSPSINRKVTLVSEPAHRIPCDLLVITANVHLLPEAHGVNAAVYSAAGPAMQQECDRIGSCKLGDTVITRGGRLPAARVAHVAVPEREDPALLRRCHEAVLAQLVPLQARTVVFTPLGVDGRFELPMIPSAHIALACVRRFMDVAENADRLDRVVFAVTGERHLELYRTLMLDYFPPELPPPPPPTPPPPPAAPPAAGADAGEEKEEKKKKKGTKKGKKKA